MRGLGTGNFTVGTDLADFLSVDVDAQLRKLPSRRFRSVHHYPVELIRGALARGAGVVRVEVNRERVEVRDDGGPLNETLFKSLCDAFDSSLADVDRERALGYFEGGSGLAVLAAFAPNPRRVLMEVSVNGGRERVVFVRRRGPRMELPMADRGNLTAVFRRGGNARKEREAILENCSFARAKVFLNGELISTGRPTGALGLATLTPDKTGGRAGALWIPMSGDTCRVWLLDHGVRSRQIVLSARVGYVFHAAIEGVHDPDHACLKALTDEAAKLYRMLAKRFRPLPAVMKGRIEELFFRHHRLTGTSPMVENFAPFRSRPAGEHHSLRELREEETAGNLYAVKAGARLEQYDTSSHRVFVLTDSQWDFLSQEVGLNLRIPPRVPRGDGALRAVVENRLMRGGEWLARVLAGPLKPMARDLLCRDEEMLLVHIRKQLLGKKFHLPWVAGAGEVNIFMVDRKGRSPALTLIEGSTVHFAVFRRHPFVEDAIEAIARDAGNIRMVLSVLTNGHDGRSIAP